VDTSIKKEDIISNLQAIDWGFGPTADFDIFLDDIELF